MSADNYYEIKRHPNGGYTPVMGFASDDTPLVVDPKRHQSFSTPYEAYDEAAKDWIIEYGIHFDREVLEDMKGLDKSEQIR